MSSHLRALGVNCVTVPEVATMLINAGISNIGEIAREDGQAYCDFQREVFLTQRSLRVRARSLAQKLHEAPAIILYDRGELDGMAYHSHDCFEGLAAEDNTTIDGIRDSYDAIIHLVTTARGAEDFYSSANNSARWDTLDEARRFDRKILSVWEGNSRHYVVDNHVDFAGKLHAIIDILTTVMDAPTQTSWEFAPEGGYEPGEAIQLDLGVASETSARRTLVPEVLEPTG